MLDIRKNRAIIYYGEKMGKRKYEKPSVQSLDSVEIAQGSCYSGTVEYTTGNCSTTGGAALYTCGGGSVVLPGHTCVPLGAGAGYSCINGHTAG
jgi:hypothetical protein